MLRRALTLLAAAMLTTGCAVLTPDYSQFRGVTLPPGDQHTEPVQITISAFDNLSKLQDVCSKADGSNAAAGPLRAYLGCAIGWTKGCAIAVWTSTAYEVLGHELMHCVWGPRTQAGRTDGIPPHFIKPPPADKREEP